MAITSATRLRLGALAAKGRRRGLWITPSRGRPVVPGGARGAGRSPGGPAPAAGRPSRRQPGVPRWRAPRCGRG
ncbi:MAG: hypothetical protein ACFNME_10355, partial [Actinomyces dentalis]